MTDSIVYNIPDTLVRAYRGRNLIVRSRDPARIVASLTETDMDSVSYVQILSLNGDIEALMRWGQPVPVDLLVQDPRLDLPFLYEYAPLLTNHPVRVTVPLIQGFSKVVKLSTSLNFAVKLEGSQPSSAVAKELSQVVNYYLHQETLSEPVEYLHSLFLAYYRGAPLSLWAVQEEDPTRNRFITEAGEEALSPRFPPVHPPHDVASFVNAFRDSVLVTQGECTGCDFLEYCLGYFKWPRKDYACDGLKSIFQRLKQAAAELREDLAPYHGSRGGDHP